MVIKQQSVKPTDSGVIVSRPVTLSHVDTLPDQIMVCTHWKAGKSSIDQEFRFIAIKITIWTVKRQLNVKLMGYGA
jgi:hypothetical protein